MKQITEDYCSFEIAQLLKEKGFDEYCGTSYTTTEGYPIRVMGSTYSLERNSDYDNFHYSMPSQSLALKWLREEKGIYLDVFIDDDSEMPWTYNIHKELMDGTTECVCHHHGNYYPLQTGYEEAVEAALLYVLKNLI